ELNNDRLPPSLFSRIRQQLQTRAHACAVRTVVRSDLDRLWWWRDANRRMAKFGQRDGRDSCSRRFWSSTDANASDLQKLLPSWAPPDYARLKLESLAHDPHIALAWDLRNVDKSAANLELAKVTQAFLELQRNPAADPKRMQELREYGA